MKAGVLQGLEVAKSHNLGDLQSQLQGCHLPTTQERNPSQHSPLAKSLVVRNSAKRCSARRLANPVEAAARTPPPSGLGLHGDICDFLSLELFLFYFRRTTSAEISVMQKDSFKVLLTPPGKL